MKARGVKAYKYHESKRRRSLHSRDEWQRALVYTSLTTMTSMDTLLALHVGSGGGGGGGGTWACLI
jgi:hypothetical protein